MCPSWIRDCEETLLQAAYEAGFKQVDFEFEPVAAALYYELSIDRPQNALIFDFGGGTLDLTIMRLGDPRDRKVYSSAGIGVAGSDFDRAIIQKRMLPHFGEGKVDHDPDVLELINTVPDWMALPELSTPHARLKLEQAILEGKAPARFTDTRIPHLLTTWPFPSTMWWRRPRSLYRARVRRLSA